MSVPGGQASAVIDIDNVAITSLATGDDHSSRSSDLDRRAVGGINVLTFVIFKAPAPEWIPSAANSAFQLTHHRPNGRNHAVLTQEGLVHSHIALEFGRL